jgi:hypothetical protein
VDEIIFIVNEDIEQGFTARGLGISIFTEAETLDELKLAVKEAVNCHFDDGKKRIIRLHLVQDVIIAS